MLAGLRHGRTLGSPLALVVRNRDHENWAWGMSPWPPEDSPTGKGTSPVTLPRPGHADLAGVLKYGHDDTRDALERASARQTAVQVAAGAVAKALLREIGVEVDGARPRDRRRDGGRGMAAGDGRRPQRPRHPRRGRRGTGARCSTGARLLRREGHQAGCAPRRGGDGDPGREGCRDRRRVRARTAPGIRGTRRDRRRAAQGDESRGRNRRRCHERRTGRRSGGHEATAHVDATAPLGGSRDGRAGRGSGRAERRAGGRSPRRRRRGGGGLGARARGAREVRRRCAQRLPRRPRRVPGAHPLERR